MTIAAAILLPMLGAFGLWDPWETHYGEVGRQLTERNDWISSWWGSLWKNGQGAQEGTYFFSKPIYLMWMMALGLEVFGFSEWGIRLGVALIAIVAVVMAYSMGQRIWSRRVGFLMALVMGTSPFFFFLSRQAQTDMPFAGNMTIGLCFFMMAIFGRDREAPARKGDVYLVLALLLLVAVPQIVLVWSGLSAWRGLQMGPVGAFFVWGPVLGVIYALIVAAVILTTLRQKDVATRQIHLFGFYIFIGLATLSKGLLGLGLPGVFILLYLVLTGEWRRLREMEIPRGIGIFIVTCFPWYIAMLVRHGNAYFQRFFIHDHFKRLATGVHQIDSGSFEHYVVGRLRHVALGRDAAARRAAALSGQGPRGPQRQAEGGALSGHLAGLHVHALHALVDQVPPLHLPGGARGGLPGGPLCRRHALDRPRSKLTPLLWALIAGLTVFVGWDLIADPQHLKNLFTYKYDRKWHTPWSDDFRVWLGALVATGSLGAILLASRHKQMRRASIGLIGAAGIGMAVFCLWVYMPTISSTWSQKGVWDAYYERCTRTEGRPATTPRSATAPSKR